jgi:hypothetical protein
MGREYHGRYNRDIASSTTKPYLPGYFRRDLLSAAAEKIGLSQTRFLSETWFVSLKISATLPSHYLIWI